MIKLQQKFKKRYPKIIPNIKSCYWVKDWDGQKKIQYIQLQMTILIYTIYGAW